MLITDTGRVEQRVVELPGPVSDAAVADLRATLNAHMPDRPLADAGALILGAAASRPTAPRTAR